MANETIYGCVDWSTGKIKFAQGDCAYKNTCMNWSGVHAGQVEIEIYTEVCDDTYYACVDWSTGKFQVEIPDNCCEACGYCSGETPDRYLVTFSGISYSSCFKLALNDYDWDVPALNISVVVYHWADCRWYTNPYPVIGSYGTMTKHGWNTGCAAPILDSGTQTDRYVMVQLDSSGAWTRFWVKQFFMAWGWPTMNTFTAYTAVLGLHDCQSETVANDGFLGGQARTGTATVNAM